jgi:hypothetical protein
MTMKLYDLSEEDVHDLRALITSTTLSISGAQAMRVAVLQDKLSKLQPLESVSMAEFAVVQESLEGNVKRADHAEHEHSVVIRELEASARRELDLVTKLVALERELCTCNAAKLGEHLATCEVSLVYHRWQCIRG